MNKGMAYTTFALAASGILMMLAIMPFQGYSLGTGGDAALIGQAAFYLDGIGEDMRRAHDIAFDRTLGEATNYIINTQQPLENPEEQLASIMVNASVNGQELPYMVNASMENWAGRVRNLSRRSDYRLRIRFVSANFSKKTEFVISSELAMWARLEDPRTRAAFNETFHSTKSSSITGLEDPMIRIQTADTYGHFFSRCGFSRPAEQLYTGTVSSGSTVWGEAYVEPNISRVNDFQSSVLVTSDLAQYNPDSTQQFTGVVAADTVANPGDYNDNYVIGTGSISEIQDNESLILDENEVWNSRFRYMLENSCYMVSSGPLNGPGFLDRLQNRLVGTGATGLVSLVNETEAPDAGEDVSNVDYVYFNSSAAYGPAVSIDGVTTGGGNSVYYEWFRLDQYHVDHWNLNALND
ncbi:MAG: hypothetical protein ABEJ75_01775 [Candidatus Nanohaloarchaea archaeon]